MPILEPFTISDSPDESSPVITNLEIPTLPKWQEFRADSLHGVTAKVFHNELTLKKQEGQL